MNDPQARPAAPTSRRGWKASTWTMLLSIMLVGLTMFTATRNIQVSLYAVIAVFFGVVAIFRRIDEAAGIESEP